MRAVLERDFVCEVSRRRAFLFRAFAAAAVVLVMAFVFEESRWQIQRRPDTLGTTLFVGGSVALVAVLALLTPPSVVGSVLEERQRETLPLVLTTPIGPFGFAAAKLLARAGSVMVWAAAAVVPLSVVTLLGGVSGWQIADLALLSTGVVLEMAGWGIAISSYTRRLATAVVMSYLLPFARWTAFMLAGIALSEPGPGMRPGRSPLTEHPDGTVALFVATPLPGLTHMMEPRAWDRAVADIYRWSGTPVPALATEPAASFLFTGIVLAAAGVLVAGRRLRREAEPPRHGAPGWLMQRMRRPVPDGGDAMRWKETRLLNAAASRPLYYSVLVLLAASETIWAVATAHQMHSERFARELAYAMFGCQVTLLGLVAAIVGAAAVAQERSLGTLDLLRATPLTPLEFLRAKTAGAIRGIAFLALIPLLHILVMGGTGLAGPVTLVVAALYGVLVPGFWAWIGTAAGLGASRPATAVARAGVAFAVMLIALPLAALVADEVFRDNDICEFLITGFQPATVALGLDFSELKVYPHRQPDLWYGGRRPSDEHFWSVFWSVVFAVGLLAIRAWAPRAAARQFDRERDGG